MVMTNGFTPTSVATGAISLMDPIFKGPDFGYSELPAKSTAVEVKVRKTVLREEFQWPFLRQEGQLQIGDIVSLKTGNGYFKSDTATYEDAVVVQVQPLVLVSRNVEMKWTKLTQEDVVIVGKASNKQLFACSTRLKSNTLAKPTKATKTTRVKEVT